MLSEEAIKRTSRVIRSRGVYWEVLLAITVLNFGMLADYCSALGNGAGITGEMFLAINRTPDRLCPNSQAREGAELCVTGDLLSDLVPSKT